MKTAKVLVADSAFVKMASKNSTNAPEGSTGSFVCILMAAIQGLDGSLIELDPRPSVGKARIDAQLVTGGEGGEKR